MKHTQEDKTRIEEIMNEISNLKTKRIYQSFHSIIREIDWQIIKLQDEIKTINSKYNDKN